MLFDRINSRQTFWLFQAAVLVFFISLTSIVGVEKFSPDSWSYFELSKSVVSDNFYAFNTYRSYFSLERSTSFPFGFPVLLALINSQFGWDPANAARINGLLAAVVFFLIYHMSRRFQLEVIPAIAVAVAFVFWPGFLDEVVSGRAYPAALVALLFGLLILTTTSRFWPIFLGALCVGISTNVRFDFLFGAWTVMVLCLLYFNPTIRAFLIAQIGFLVGGLPWVIYSVYFFGTPWVSDNSWVSLASHSAYVTDFPAASVGTIFSEPMEWTIRILGNILRLSEAVVRSLPDYLLVVLLLASCVLFLPFRYLGKALKWGFLILLLLSFSLVPYALTGYFDERYFSLFFLSISLGLLVLLSVGRPGVNLDPVLSVWTLTVCFVASLYWMALAGNVLLNLEQVERRMDVVDAISLCHDEEPGVAYVFSQDVGISVFRYGAVSGKREAVGPNNLDWSDLEAVRELISVIGPIRQIISGKFESCDQFFAKNPLTVGGRGGDGRG